MKHRVIKCVRTCIACPSQWEAETDDGRRIYVRFRFGSGYAAISEPGGELPVGGGTIIAEWDSDDGLSGDLTVEEMMDATAAHLDWSECAFSIAPSMQSWAQAEGVAR